MILKKIKIVLLFLIAFLPYITVSAEGKTEDKKEIVAQVLYNNIPQPGRGVIATNYSVAYNKLVNGEIKEEDFQHQSYAIVRAKYSETSTNNSIEISNGIVVEAKKKLTSDQATKAIISLYKNSRDFLNYLNTDDDGDEERPIKLLTPGTSKSFVTNEEGKINGKLRKGFTIFETDYKKRTITSEFIDDNTDIVEVGTTKKVDGLDIFISNVKTDSDLSASADYGQKIIYEIDIDHKKILDSTSLKLHPSPNFVIDDINVPYTKEFQDSYSSIDVAPDGAEFINHQFSSIELAEKSVSSKLARADYIMEYTLKLNNNAPSKVLITGHVASHVDFNIDFKFNDGGGYKEFPNYKFTVKNEREIQGLYVDYLNDDGQIIQVMSPIIKSYGINFAMVDGQTNTLSSGATYGLGRYSDEDVYLLTKKGYEFSWEKTNFTISDKNMSSEAKRKDGFTLEGGKILNIDGTVDDIELSKQLFSYNEEENKRLNNSLIQLRGLSGSEKYFVYQINQKKGIQNNTKIYDFSVSEDSIEKAQFENYLVNGYIPDYSTNNNEYNALELLKSGEHTKKPMNPYLRIGMIFVGISAFVILLGIQILKRY